MKVYVDKAGILVVVQYSDLFDFSLWEYNLKTVERGIYTIHIGTRTDIENNT